MLDVLLFGATGHTGALTARALARRGAAIAVAGRNRARLRRLADEVAAHDVRVADARDPDAIAAALGDVRVLLTCVGPFTELGAAPVDAALAAGVHHVDASGEAGFVAWLVAERDALARSRGVVLAPCLAFNEVPADVAATLAGGGLAGAELDVTYALPSYASPGSVRSAVEVLGTAGTWLEARRRVPIVAGERTRWAPMPDPLGPRPALAAPLGEAHLAPLHLDVSAVRTYVTTGTVRRHALRAGLPLLRGARRSRAGRRAAQAVLARMVASPDSARAQRARWTIVAEARADGRRRAAVVTGADTYGLSAELLAGSALHLARESTPRGGVVAPVPAVGLERLRSELEACGVSIDVF